MAPKKNNSKSKKSREGVKKAAKSTKAKRTNVLLDARFPMLLHEALISPAPAVPVPASIDIKFIGGIGQITTSLFRNGLMINSQSVSNDGVVFFSDAQSRDVISINGVATGVNPGSGKNIPNAAVITINRSTSPSTPQSFPTGFVIAGYVVQ